MVSEPSRVARELVCVKVSRIEEHIQTQTTRMLLSVQLHAGMQLD